MTSERAAFFDIGTNTILCLIVEIRADRSFNVLDDLAEITRLGQGVDQTRRISPEGEKRTRETLSRYGQRLRDLDVTQTSAVATSAMRDAENSAQVRRRLGDE